MTFHSKTFRRKNSKSTIAIAVHDYLNNFAEEIIEWDVEYVVKDDSITTDTHHYALVTVEIDDE